MIDKRLWRITNHVCRICKGRILKSSDDVYVKCSDCAVELKSAKTVALCSCGQKLKNGRKAGFKCVINKDHMPGTGQEVAAEYVE